MAAIAFMLALVLSSQIRAGAVDDLVAEAVGSAAGPLLQALTPADLQEPMTGARYRSFDAFVQMSIVSERTARIKLWSKDGTVIYSDDPANVGLRFPENLNLQRALEGANPVEIMAPQFPETARERHLGTLMTVYTPLSFQGEVEPQGVLEIYQYYAPTAQRIRSLQRQVVAGIGIGFLVLYGALVSIVWGGWRTIDRQQSALSRTNAELHTVNLERERLLIAEREKHRLAESLGKVGLALNATLDLPDLLDLICRESMNLFDAGSSFLWLVQEDELVGYAGHGSERQSIIGSRIPLSDPSTLGSRVIREKRPTFVNKAMKSKQINQKLLQVFRIKSILGVPLVRGSEAMGALMIIDHENSQRFEEGDIQSATVLASHAAVAIENAKLVENLQQSNLELALSYDTTLEGWSRVLELRDHETEGHTRRVTEMTLRLARALGVAESELVHFRRGALLHDIGKMGIPDSILLKPGPLTEEEWAVMRKHPEYARSMLASITYLRPALDIPYCHHEKWDGTGYPRGLKGEGIPLAARIFSVVDVWDALLSDRPYRPAWSVESARSYLHEQAGTHFDPRVVEVFFSLEAVYQPRPATRELVPIGRRF